MPNHVENHISLQGDPAQIRTMLKAIQSDEYGIGSVDFNKIIPMPESLNIECGSRGNRGYELYKEYLGRLSLLMSPEDRKALKTEYLEKVADDPEVFELGKQYYENLKEYKATTWYDWSVNN